MKETLRNTVDEKGYVQLALKRAYELLAHKEDPLGSLFEKQEKKLFNALKTRNHSILAHGVQAIDEKTYAEVSGNLLDFLFDGLKLVQEKPAEVPQLPNSIPAGWCGEVL